MTTNDALVVSSGAIAASASWWGHWIEWLPAVAQVGITTGSFVFVLFRAASEIRKFWRNRKEELEE